MRIYQNTVNILVWAVAVNFLVGQIPVAGPLIAPGVSYAYEEYVAGLIDANLEKLMDLHFDRPQWDVYGGMPVDHLSIEEQGFWNNQS